MSLEAPKDIPEIWRPHFDQRGVDFTFSALARQVDGVSINTIIRALTGEGTPTRRVATKIGAALGVSADEFYRTRSELVGDEKPEPFHLPPRASNLAVSDRRVVVSVVDALLGRRDPHTAHGGGPDQLAATTRTVHELLADFPAGSKARRHIAAAATELEAALYETHSPEA